jgi:peroxiredoxin
MRLISSFCGALLLFAITLHGAGELSGRRAPGFSLPESSLRQHDLADYRGKIVLIEIMQTSCPHCRVFSKVLEEVKAQYGNRVAILSVVRYPSDNQATVARYVAETGTTTPILFDCGQMTASYMKASPGKNVVDMPHLFVVDGKGIIRNDFGYGPATKEIFEGRALFLELRRILAGGSAAKEK